MIAVLCGRRIGTNVAGIAVGVLAVQAGAGLGVRAGVVGVKRWPTESPVSTRCQERA